MSVHDGIFTGTNLATAWLSTIDGVHAADGGRLFHTVTRVLDPSVSDPRLELEVDAQLRQLRKQSLATVTNTLFPAELAASCTTHSEMAERYRRVYDRLRRTVTVDGGRPNSRGTYFGRLVAYPTARGKVDQLERTIDNLRRGGASDAPMSCRYEVSVGSPHDIPDPHGHQIEPEASPAQTDPTATVFDSGYDRLSRGFPCLSSLAFQLDNGSVHLVAHYRYQYLLERGLGNYLALGGLLGHVARHANLEVGQLMVVTGRACADHLNKQRMQRLVDYDRPTLLDLD